VPSRLYDRPIGAALAGALAISFSGILFRAAHVSPSTGAFYRCALALPVLWPLSWLEDRRFGPRPLRQRALAALAGVFFAVDLVAWHEGIEQVGAGLATVLGNLQVVFVGRWRRSRLRSSASS
jgi:drug/metabolite transporter (DMT)-like permease